jgi:hypothetical protein
MITSIIATIETLCYLLGPSAAQKVTIEDTRYCPVAVQIMHSGLYGLSRHHVFAEGNQSITLSYRIRKRARWAVRLPAAGAGGPVGRQASRGRW